MTNSYPDRHHPVFFLQDALLALGAEAIFNHRDERTAGCWGLMINDQPFVWLIDNRHPHEAIHEDPAAQELLARGALVCCAQKPDAERIGARWLPLAITPGYQVPEHKIAKCCDVAFIGYIRDEPRMQMLAHVMRHFSLCVQQGLFGAEAVSAYQSARVGLNVPTGYGSPASYDSANMRCFEILATGTPLLTSHEDYLPDLGLVDGETCLTYHDADEMIEQIRKALADPDWAGRIGQAGARLAEGRHRYEARARQVITWLK